MVGGYTLGWYVRLLPSRMGFGRRRWQSAGETAGPERYTPLVRTWFGDQNAWEALLASVRIPSQDGFVAHVSVVDDRAQSDTSPSHLAALVSSQSKYSIVIAADQRAMIDPEHPLLVVLANGTDEPQTLRVISSELWGIENNMSLANMEWESFAEAADSDGVLRAFG